MKIAIIGLGRWGKNLLREYSKICSVPICITKSDKNNIVWLKNNYPTVRHTNRFEDVLNNKNIDAVAVATPIKTHFDLAFRALRAGKHVFLEKPIATNSHDAKKLLEVANNKKLVLFVGHVFFYHPVLTKLKSIIKNEPIQYARLNWFNFGSFKEDILLDLVSQEISIILELIGTPKKIFWLDNKKIIKNSDLVTLQLDFSGKKNCIINTNRTSTYKKKSMTIITSKNLFIWEDDILYKFDRKKLSFHVAYSSKKTPLELECKEFIKSINNNNKKLVNARNAVKIIRILEMIP